MPTKADTLLETYRGKRDFAKTSEPSGGGRRQPARSGGQKLTFVVQKHAASRLHYDFRLELDGVLKSWAVTRGPSLNPSDKRLAVRVEDHPLDYGGFEGTIPEGQYGGGTVMLWDEGSWEPHGDPHEGLKSGEIKFRLGGQRLKGEWVLVRMKPRKGEKRENWLLIKHRDAFARRSDGVTDEFTTSVESGRGLEAIAEGKPAKGAKGARRKAASAKSGGQKSGNVWTHGKAVTLPAFRPPELATLVDRVPEGRAWLFEMKFDGYRCLAAIAGEEVRLYTRKGLDWTRQFGAIRQPLSELTGGSALIDGEICAFKDGRTDFSALKAALSDGGPLVYFAFDLLELDGEDLTDLPLSERKGRLKALLGKLGRDSPVQFSDHVEGSGEQVLDAMCKGGFEGVIAKRAGARYRSERTRDWLKVKCLHRQEFVIGGWRPSTRRDHFASLLLGTWDNDRLVYHGRVGTGFNQKSAAELQTALDARARKDSPFAEVPRDIRRAARWVDPQLVAEIAYTEMTPDGALRHPSFLGLRQDKPAREIVLETPATPPPSRKAEPAGTKRPPSKPKRSRAKSKAEITTAAGAAAAETAGIKLSHPDRVSYPGQGVTKGELAAYYAAVAEAMLPHIVDRPLSLVRCPQGRARHCFYQKHDTGAFPDALKPVTITEKDGSRQDYLYVDDLAGLIAGVQMNVLEFHIWGCKRGDIERPDRIIFDIDPDPGIGFEPVREAARDMRKALGEMGLETFAMVTGGKGIHVVAPITPERRWPEIKAFCKGFAQRLADAEPERFVANMAKAKRHGRMFIDYLRNERGATAIAPWSTRSREGAPVATPVSWSELGRIEAASAFSLAEAAARMRRADPWKGYFDIDQTITEKMMAAIGAGG